MNEKDIDNDNRNSMIVEVGGNQVKVLLDSGADISVIPSKYVAEADYTGEMVELTDFEGLVDRKRRTAVVRLSVGNKMFKERVAISDHLGSKGLLQLDLNNKERMEVVMAEFYSQNSQDKVCAVKTRQMSREEAIQNEEERVQLEEEMIVLSNGSDGGEHNYNGSEIGKVDEINNIVSERSVVNSNGTNVDKVIEVDENCNKEGDNKITVEEVELECIQEGGDKEKFVKEVEEDGTLKVCKSLAARKERGYLWENGILLHRIIDPVHGEVNRIVVPKARRELLCRLAHDRLGHLGFRKVKQILGRRFTWPNMGSEIEKFCVSCSKCQAANRQGQKRAPMVERPILSEPFEAVAVDIVGPFPPSKGKFRYLLTSICMATRWPDVVLLKTVTAKAVADGLVQIFGRTGLPYVLLSDNGSQFTGRLMKEFV